MCYASLREYSDLQVPNIDNKTSHCIDNGDKINVTFTKHVIVSGIVLQGDSEKNDWITKFSLHYENSKDEKPLTDISTVSNLCNHLIFTRYVAFSYMLIFTIIKKIFFEAPMKNYFFFLFFRIL